MSWTTSTLGHLVQRDSGLIQTGPFGSQLHQSDYVAEGIPTIMPKDIVHGRVDEKSVARVSEETAERLGRHRLKPRTIVLPRRGEVTKRAFIREDQTGWLCGTGCLQIVLGGDHLAPEFLYFYMEQPEVVQWLEQHAVGTTMLNLNMAIVSELPVRYPPPESQHRIADILSAYDELIENNQRRMALLEAAARELYREWFVRLRFPGHEHTRITDGVPEGWDSGVISDFFDTTSGGTPSRQNPDFYSGTINWVKTQELNDDFIFETEERITEDAVAKSSAKVFSVNTLLVSIYGGTNIGRTGILAEPSATNQACCALFPKDPRANSIYGALYFRDQRQKLIGLAQGAAQTNISQQVIRALPIRFPPAGLMTPFVEWVEPMFEQSKTLKRQNMRLRAARDLLLPRLMSGELPV